MLARVFMRSATAVSAATARKQNAYEFIDAAVIV